MRPMILVLTVTVMLYAGDVTYRAGREPYEALRRRVVISISL